jgi:hypothetical protein
VTEPTTIPVPTIGRATTRKRVKEAAPEGFHTLTDPYRGLCQAIELRGDHSTDDATVRAALEAVACLVSMVDVECVTYILALGDKIAQLEKELVDLQIATQALRHQKKR